ncbi:MAG: tetratricopeptide repeat protein [Calditrichia bacterium]
MNKIITFIVFVLISAFSFQCAIFKPTPPAPIKMIDAEMNEKARHYYLKGIMDEFQMDYENALLNYYMARAFDKDNIALTIAIAETQMELGEYDVALIFLEEALQVFPKEKRFLLKKAEALTKSGRLKDAYLVYKSLLLEDPNNYYYQLVMRNILQVLKDTQEQEWLFRFLAEKLSRPEFWVDLGKFYLQQNKLVSAREAFQQALQMDSTNISAMAGLVDGYIQSGEFEKAIPLLESIYDHTDDQYFFNKILELYYQAGDLNKMVEFLQQAITKNEATPKFHYMLANIYYQLKQYDNARNSLDSYRKMVSDPDEDYYSLKGRIYLESKQDTLALKTFEKGLSKYPDSEQLSLLYAYTLANLKMYDQAVAFLKKATPKFPNSVRFLTMHAQILFEQGKEEEMIPITRHILERDSSNHFGLTFLASYYMNREDHHIADSLFRVALNYYPDDPLILNNYAYYLSEHNLRLNEALSMVEKAINREQNNPAYLDTKGWILFKLGHIREALKLIQKAAKLKPDDEEIYDHLGDIFWKLNDKEKARFYWKKVLEINPDKEKVKSKLDHGL